MEIRYYVFSRGKSKAFLVIFVKRKIRFYMVIKIKDGVVASILKVIKKYTIKEGVKFVYDR